MRIAVLSDIHGNHIALTACLNYCRRQGVERYIFLGDYLGEFACPETTMDMLYALQAEEKCTFIRGNKEDYWLEHGSRAIKWKDYDSTTGALNYVYNRLREKDMAFFAGLPDARPMKLFGIRMLACHGSPYRTKEEMGQDEKTARMLRTIPAPVILRGHSHIQEIFTLEGKTVVNGGSVGLSFKAGGLAQFMILEDEPLLDAMPDDRPAEKTGLVPGGTTGEGGVREYCAKLPGEGRVFCRMISLPYDTEQAIQNMREERLDLLAPAWFKITVQALRGGDVTHSTVLLRAIELCRADQGVCAWPDIPEKYWEQALADCGCDNGVGSGCHTGVTTRTDPAVTVVAAYAHNRVMGNEGRIPWKIRGEQLRFKELTLGQIVVMGRRTFEEINKPLPGRTTVVLSKTKQFGEPLAIAAPFRAEQTAEGLYTAASLQEVLAAFPGREEFVAGGERLYAEALPLARRLCLTEIDGDFPGDTFFPEIPEPEAWVRETGDWTDTEPPYRYLTYTRRE